MGTSLLLSKTQLFFVSKFSGKLIEI